MAELTLSTRLTFIGLWNYADDEGKGVDDPRIISSTLYPFGDIGPDEVVEHIAALEQVGVIERYEVDGRQYFRIPSWHSHQSIARPQVSRLPDPDGRMQERVSDTSMQEGKGRDKERKGYTPEFERFWLAYPLRKGKAAAARAFHRALGRASAAEIIAGAQRYADDPQRKPDFTKYAEGWLNADRWLDEATPDTTDTVVRLMEQAR